MKVLHVNTHANIGGIGNYILSLSEALLKRGVPVVIASSGGNLEGEFAFLGIPHRKLSLDTKNELDPRVLWSAFRLSRIVREENIGIIHAHSRVSQVVASIASRLAGVPFVTTCHGYFRKRLRGVFDTWGTRVIAISDAVRKHLEDDLGVSHDRIRLVYSGVDIARFSSQRAPEETGRIRSSLGFGDCPVVGTVGRLSPVKGHRFFLEAVARLARTRDNIRALIVGDGPEEDALKKMSALLGVGSKITFITSTIDTAKYLSIMDVFVFPSVKEGLGLGLLEAMAAGRACVASDVGGIGDVIRHGSNGMLVGSGDSQAISRAVDELLSDAGLRRRLGEAARATVTERFDIGRMAEEVIRVYNEAALL